MPASSKTASASLCPAGPQLRDSGIPLLGETPWGAHICMFYETEGDLLDSCISFFEAGLQSNEFCVWVVSEPLTVETALAALREGIADSSEYLDKGQFQILPGEEWYLRDGRFDPQEILSEIGKILAEALTRGFEGVRGSGNALWLGSPLWKEFYQYEQYLDDALAGQKLLVLCTYRLGVSRATDVLDVARAHQCSIARRRGRWELLEPAGVRQAKREIDRLNSALEILSRPSPGAPSLTPRERIVLAQIIRGASSKEMALTLGIAPRTVEFHRANIMRKFEAKNTADLVRSALAKWPDTDGKG